MAEPYVTIEVDWPLDKSGRIRAAGKGRAKFARRGDFVTAYTPAKTRKFENTIKAAAIAAMAARSLNPLNEALGLRVMAYLPIPESWSARKTRAALAGDIVPTSTPDWDNLAKVACDGLNPRRGEPPIIWRDDALVISAQCMKLYDRQPRLRIEVFRWFA